MEVLIHSDEQRDRYTRERGMLVVIYYCYLILNDTRIIQNSSVKRFVLFPLTHPLYTLSRFTATQSVVFREAVSIVTKITRKTLITALTHLWKQPPSLFGCFCPKTISQPYKHTFTHFLITCIVAFSVLFFAFIVWPLNQHCLFFNLILPVKYRYFFPVISHF